MKAIILLALLIAAPAMSQSVIMDDGDWVDVPDGKQVVFIPKDLPQQCHVVCKAEVMYPQVPPTEIIDIEYCDQDGGLVVSPSVCTVRPDE